MARWNVDDLRSRRPREAVAGQEPVRAEKRAQGHRRAQRDGAIVAAGAVGLRDPVHGPQPGRRLRVVPGRGCAVPREPHRGRRRGRADSRDRSESSEPRDQPHRDPRQRLRRDRQEGMGRRRLLPAAQRFAARRDDRSQHDRAAGVGRHRQDRARESAGPRADEQHRAARRLRHHRHRPRRRQRQHRDVSARRDDRTQRDRRRKSVSVSVGESVPGDRRVPAGVRGVREGRLSSRAEQRVAARGNGRERSGRGSHTDTPSRNRNQ